MKLLKARFRNFGSYGNDIQEIVFGDGINLISGSNGAGKSTLLEPLFFGLYGKPFKKGNLADIVNWTNEGGEEVWLDLQSGKHDIEIYRTMSDQRLTVDGVEKTEFATNKTAFQKEIDRLVGCDHSLFKKLAIISADSVKAVPEMKAGEKREMVDEYFSLKIIAIMLSIAKNRRTGINTDKDIIEKRLIELSGEISKIKNTIELTKETMDSTIKQIEIDIKKVLDVELVEALSDIHKAIDTKKQSILDYEEEQKNLGAKINEAEKERIEKVSRIKEKLSSLESDKKSKIEESKNKNDEIEKSISEKTKSIEVVRLEEAKKSNDDIKQLEHDLKLQLYLKSKQDVEIESLESDLSLKTKELREFKKERDYQIEIKTIDSRLSEISLLAKQGANTKKFLDENDVCPTCNHELTDDHKAEEIEKLKKERKLLIDEKSTITNKKETLEGEILKIQKINEEIENIQKSIDSLKQTKRDAEFNIVSFNDKIDTIKSISGLPSKRENEIKDEISKLESSKIDITKIENEYDSRINKGNALLQATERPIEDDSVERSTVLKTKIENEKDGIQELQERIEKTKKSIQDRVLGLESKKECKDLSGRIAKSQDQLKLKVDAEASELENFKKSEHDLEVMENVILALSDKGVKTHFIKQFVPTLNRTIKDLLRMFSLPITVTFDEKLTVSVKNLGSRKKAKYFQHSKGERKRIDFVILLAFIDNVMKIMNWRTNFIIFDEFLDGGMDSKGMDDIIEMLHTFAESYDLGVYIITHKVSNDYFKERWMIEKEDGFSRIEVKR